jgi:hypothetical protein
MCPIDGKWPVKKRTTSVQGLIYPIESSKIENFYENPKLGNPYTQYTNTEKPDDFFYASIFLNFWNSIDNQLQPYPKKLPKIITN